MSGSSRHPLSRSQGGGPFNIAKFQNQFEARKDSSHDSSEGKPSSPTAANSPITSGHPLALSLPPRKKKSNDPFSPYIITLPKYVYSTKILHGNFDVEAVATLEGPSSDSGDCEGVRYESANPLLPEIFAKSITTYPQFPGLANPEGHPICDRYSVKATRNGTVCAIADGCGWGERAKDAALCAINSFLSYMEPRVHKLKDVHRAAEVMLKAFREAQLGIMKHTHTSPDVAHQCLDCGQCGTTALLGGILVPLETHQGVDNLVQPKWGFLCCSVGDCKAFCVSRNKVTEITVGSRYGAMDASDCGGRLGPQIEGEPDLRNLQLFFHPCHVNDVILLLSDGIHDNFDPEHLGKSPRECRIPADTWAGSDRDEAMSIKDLFRARLLEDTLFGFHSLEKKVEAVLAHCVQTTSNSRSWLLEHKGRLPHDYSRFPGKMDHSTIVAVKVPMSPMSVL